MLTRIVFIACLIFFLAGCATVPRKIEPVKTEGVYHTIEKGQTLWRIAKTYGADVNEIMRANGITDPIHIRAGDKLFIPDAKALLKVEIYRPITKQSAEKLVGPKYRFSRWHYITLHHSATPEGNAESFDKNHRRRGMGGLFYHFVIGNGTISGDGEVEVGRRWKKQKEVNRPCDIQICLVGNFNKKNVTTAQFDALVKLINVLRGQYNIPLYNIRKHKDVSAKISECPGNNFPFYKLITELRKTSF